MPRRQHSGTDETYANCTNCTFSWGKDTISYCMYSMARQHFGTTCINCTFSSQWISKQRNAVSRSNSSQTMLEGVYGCFMICNVFLAGNSEVSWELQCFTAELITYIVCECNAPEWVNHQSPMPNHLFAGGLPWPTWQAACHRIFWIQNIFFNDIQKKNINIHKISECFFDMFFIEQKKSIASRRR